MNVFPSKSLSDNQKSKIQNLKWLGLSVFAFVLVVAGAVAQAKQATKIARLGYLSSLSRSSDPRAEPLRRALRELGYIEGQNLAVEYRYADGKVDRYPELAAELVRLKVDIIVVAGGDPPILAAKNATKTIPIVMIGIGSDPVEAGHVESLARPGGNITGVTNLGRELGGKRLDLLKEAVPKTVRIAIVYDPAIPAARREVKEDVPVAARALGLTIRSWQISTADAFQSVFAAITKDFPDGLYVLGAGPLTAASNKRIADFAAKRRLPSVGGRPYVDAGGLMSYGADATDSYRRVATYVDKILKGAKPGDLPIQQPTKFEFVINLKTAKQIGLTIPPNVLARADKVIR
jgi:putative ABC transport system substrate-binding protein